MSSRHLQRLRHQLDAVLLEGQTHLGENRLADLKLPASLCLELAADYQRAVLKRCNSLAFERLEQIGIKLGIGSNLLANLLE